MVVERNVLRRTGGACIFVVVRNDLGGEVNAQILDNDLDECHPLGRAGAIFVAPSGVINPTTEPVAAQAARPFRPLRGSQAGHLRAGHGARERPEPPTERAAPA